MSMRMIALLLVIIGTAVGSCSDKHRVPKGILPREKMEDVLWDMIQADQYTTYFTKDSAHIDLKLERLRLYQQVFLLHDVSREEFQKSYKFYMDHPDLTQTLFDSLLSKSNRLRGEAYSHPSPKPVAPVPVPAPDTTHRSPDTAHRSPVHPSILPMFRHPRGTTDTKHLAP
jgi:hypothetical protein